MSGLAFLRPASGAVCYVLVLLWSIIITQPLTRQQVVECTNTTQIETKFIKVGQCKIFSIFENRIHFTSLSSASESDDIQTVSSLPGFLASWINFFCFSMTSWGKSFTQEHLDLEHMGAHSVLNGDINSKSLIFLGNKWNYRIKDLTWTTMVLL